MYDAWMEEQIKPVKKVVQGKIFRRHISSVWRGELKKNEVPIYIWLGLFYLISSTSSIPSIKGAPSNKSGFAVDLVSFFFNMA